MELFILHSCLENLGDQEKASIVEDRVQQKQDYFAKLIRGMSIDQALGQLEFSHKKGDQIKQFFHKHKITAVGDHNVQFKSNLYIV